MIENTTPLSILKENSIFFSRIGFENDPARYDDDGKLIEFGGDYKTFARYHADMHRAGVKLHTSILFNGWVGPDQYDYTFTDRTLERLFSVLPEDALYIPRVKLNAPVEWSKVHPEELFVYYGGNPDPEWIRPRVGSLEHDLLGYEAPNGYYMGKDARPNVNGQFSNASFASEVWKKDAAKALQALLTHLKESPYGKRIIGIHIAYGVSGETCMWGRFGRTYGDYSHVFRKAFLQWGIRKYGSEEKLLSAWGTLEMPSPEQRKNVTVSVEAFQRKRKEDLIVKDLDRFVSGLNSSTAEYFCKCVKEFDSSLLTGIFHGYMLDCHNAAYTGWLGLDRLLESPYLDFLAAPTSYYRREAGQSGGFLAPAQSIRRKKLWVDELDIRTYLATNAGGWFIPKECTESVFFREFAKNLSIDASYWWMDLGGGWFDSDYIKEVIQKVEKTAVTIRKQSHRSTAEILMLVDDQQQMEHTESLTLHSLYKDFRREAALAGALIDLYRVSDLKDLDLAQYKLIVLCDCREGLSFPEDKVVYSMYLDQVSPRIQLQERSTPFPEGAISWEGIFEGTVSPALGKMDLPCVIPEGDALTVHARLADGSAAVVSDGKTFYSVLPFFTFAQFRRLVEFAGCRTFGEAPCTVYGDNRFTAVFPLEKKESYSLILNGK